MNPLVVFCSLTFLLYIDLVVGSPEGDALSAKLEGDGVSWLNTECLKKVQALTEQDILTNPISCDTLNTSDISIVSMETIVLNTKTYTVETTCHAIYIRKSDNTIPFFSGEPSVYATRATNWEPVSKEMYMGYKGKATEEIAMNIGEGKIKEIEKARLEYSASKFEVNGVTLIALRFIVVANLKK